MADDYQIIIELEVSINENSDAYLDILESKLSNLKLSIKKRIIGCTIELIQNAFIHNNSDASLIITENEKEYRLSISQFLKDEEFTNLDSKIKLINAYSETELKEKYLSNIKKTTDNNTTHTGNGLIFCRLKSRNQIKFIAENTNKYKTVLNFNKHENNS